MNPYQFKVEQQMQQFYHSLSEKDRRRYAAIEAVKLGWGGITYISQLFGCDYYTIRFGIEELDDKSAMNMSEIRRSGGGRKSAFETIEELDSEFLKVIAQHTAGSPMDEQVKWTNLNRQEIAQLLKGEGIVVSVTVVDQLLEKYSYRKRKAQKRLATGSHPQRNQQFENIEQLKDSYQQAGNPVLSMDTKKKN
jgi:DNA replicative helicase MCM subunit Mcm2 (Cdc46/Mcm family)